MIALESGQPDLIGDIRMVPESEVGVVQLQIVLPAVVDEPFDTGFEQTQPAVVSVQLDIAHEMLNALEPQQVAIVWQDLEFGRFPEADLGVKVADDEGDGLTVITVRRVSNQPGTRVGLSADEHRGSEFGVRRSGIGQRAKS